MRIKKQEKSRFWLYILAIIVGIFLFGPIKEYWIGLSKIPLATLSSRVDVIEQYLNKKQIEENNARTGATPKASRR